MRELMALAVSISFFLLFSNCQNDQAPSESDPDIALDALSVSGSLALGSTDSETETKAYLTGQNVEVIDENNNVIATAQTDSTGSFQLDFDATNVAALVAGQATTEQLLGRVLHLRGVVAADGNGQVQGIQKSLILDSAKFVVSESGATTFDSGTHVTAPVGAIKGTVLLEGGGDPAGIQVYIPGTMFAARTDSNGQFVIAFLSPGRYPVRVERDGYGSIEFETIHVERKMTTDLAEVQLKVGAGPEITTFTAEVDYAPSEGLKLSFQTVNAIKYKISQWSDFRNSVFTAINIQEDTQTVDFYISGDDGMKQIYLRVADADGLEVDANLSIRLDTQAPLLTNIAIAAKEGRTPGYSRFQRVGLEIANCDDIQAVFVTENPEKTPDANDFVQECHVETLQHDWVVLSEPEGSKKLFVWGIDPVGKLSEQATTVSVVVDRTAPKLSLMPESGSYSRSIALNPEASEQVDIFYTIDGSEPNENDAQFLQNLLLVGNTQLKMIAIDTAGNRSEIIDRTYVFDNDAPILGAISIAETITSSTTITIDVTAVAADSMMFSESPTFANKSWQPFAANYSYTLNNQTDGPKRIYAKFKDNSGNEIGQNGEYTADVILDQTPPLTTALNLFFPESPSGSFDKIFLWENLSGEANVSYEIEVFSDVDYLTRIRNGVSTKTQWRVTPAFASPGTYYWRVRGVDSAGNRSDWVTSGTEKSVTIKLFATSFLPTLTLSSDRSSEMNFGYRAFPYLGDASKLFVVTPKADHTTCSDCGVVDIFDIISGTISATITADSSWKENFGYALTQCDLTNDGLDEIAIGAPYAAYKTSKNGHENVVYNSAGRVYIFEGGTHQMMDTFSLDPSNGNYYCNQTFSDGNCAVFGYPSQPSNWEVAGGLHSSADRPLTGASLACQRNNSGGDTLVIGTPGWSDANKETRGRVDFVTHNGSAIVVNPNYLDGNVIASTWSSEQFGTSLLTIAALRFENFDGPAILVGVPGHDGNSGEARAGAVYIYDNNHDLVGILRDPSEATDEGFGKRLFALGDLNNDGDYDEFAVSFRKATLVYNGDGNVDLPLPSLLYAIKRVDSMSYNFGTSVANIGDLTGDGKAEIAVSNAEFTVAGAWSSGAIFVYDQTSLTDQEASSVNDPALYKLTGEAKSNKFLGAAVSKGRDRDNDGVFDTIMATAPGHKAGRGSLRSFSEISMAPGLPTHFSGSRTGQKFATTLSPVADFDADGTVDFVVGSPFENYVYAGVGMIQVISGRTGEVLKTIYGMQENENFGIDILYHTDKLFIATAKGRIYQIQRNNVMYVIQLNERDNNGNYVHGRVESYGSNGPALHFSRKTEEVGKKPGSTWGHVIFHGTAEVYVNSVKYYGFAVVSENYLSSQKSSYDCRPGGSGNCRCFIGGSTDGEKFGGSATFINDLSGDGFVDVAVSAPSAANGSGGTGKVYLFDGTLCKERATLTISDAFLVITPDIDTQNPSDDQFGATLLAIEDVEDGDTNNATLLISNQKTDDTSSTRASDVLAISTNLQKATTLIHGMRFIAKMAGTAGNAITIETIGPTGWDPNSANVTTVTCAASGNAITFNMGMTSSTYPNLYGYWDSTLNNAIAADPGCAALITAAYDTSSGYPPAAAATSLSGGENGGAVLLGHVQFPSGSLFGAKMLNLGDLNKDRYPEIAISMSKGRGLEREDSGQIIIFSGKPFLTESTSNAFPSNAELIKFYSPTRSFSNFGASIFHADVTGDGLVDFGIGAPLWSSDSKVESGRVFIFSMQGLGSGD